MSEKHVSQKTPPSLERVNELFRYEEETGDLVRRINFYSAKAGDIAGTPTGRGPLRVGIDGERYLVHTIIWYLKTGVWPSHEIDHEDTDSVNNRWGNLRKASRSDQMANRNKASNNKSGFKGVCLDKRRGLYKAEIQKGKYKRFLGYFVTAEEAHKAYVEAAKAVHGIFARG